MDAIRHSEWRLFIILKDMEDSKAYKVFTFIHLFLYVVISFLTFQSVSNHYFGFLIYSLSFMQSCTSFLNDILEMNLKIGFQEPLFIQWDSLL